MIKHISQYIRHVCHRITVQVPVILLTGMLHDYLNIFAFCCPFSNLQHLNRFRVGLLCIVFLYWLVEFLFPTCVFNVWAFKDYEMVNKVLKQQCNFFKVQHHYTVYQCEVAKAI